MESFWLAVRGVRLPALALGAAIAAWLVNPAEPAQGGEKRHDLARREFGSHARALLARATNSINIAATDCTLALFSTELRARARAARLHGGVWVLREADPHCSVPALTPWPLPYNLELGILEPVRADEARRFVFRRELVLIDRRYLLIALSPANQAPPTRYHVYEIDLSATSGGLDRLKDLGSILWPAAFASKAPKALQRDPRWSTANHRQLTSEALLALGFTQAPVTLVQAGNIWVDRLENFFNNPQHSMRNVGQSLEAAKAEAQAWIEARTSAAVENARQGAFCCALFNLGQALHTIQDRKHGWIFLWQHLIEETISDFLRSWAPEDWARAQQETIAWCRTFVDKVRRVGGDALVAKLQLSSDGRCTCEGVAVDVSQD